MFFVIVRYYASVANFVSYQEEPLFFLVLNIYVVVRLNLGNRKGGRWHGKEKSSVTAG